MRAIAFGLIFVAQSVTVGLLSFREIKPDSFVVVAEWLIEVAALIGVIVCVIGGW